MKVVYGLGDLRIENQIIEIKSLVLHYIGDPYLIHNYMEFTKIEKLL